MAQNSSTLLPTSLFILCLFLTACAPKKELNSDLLLALGDKANAQNNMKDAEDMYERASKISPHDIVLQTKLVRLYLDQKKYASIIKVTNGMIASDVTCDAIRIRGIAFDLTGQHQKAQDTYLALLEKFPEDEKANLNLILSYVLSQQLDKAQNHRLQCLKNLPSVSYGRLESLSFLQHQ